MVEEAPIEKSKYNEAALQISRLHNLWLKIQRTREHGHANLTSWHFYMDDIWGELWSDVQKQAERDFLIRKNDLLRKIAISSRLRSKKYEALSQRHQFLKYLQDKVGKGGIYEDETEEYME